MPPFRLRSFGIRMAALMAAYYAVVLLPPVERLFCRYLELNAGLCGALLNAAGQHTSVCGVSIHSPAVTLSVRRGCDGLEPAWIFASAVLAFPARLKRKAAGIAVGSAAILAANVVRIASLYLVRLHAPGLFPAAHLEVWPAAFTLLALGLWIAWVFWQEEYL